MSEVLYIWRWKSAGVWRHYVARSWAFTAMSLAAWVFWDVVLWHWLSGSQCSDGLWCLCLQWSNSLRILGMLDGPLKMTAWHLLRCWEALPSDTMSPDLVLCYWSVKNVSNKFPAGTASHPGTLYCSLTVMWDSQIMYYTCVWAWWISEVTCQLAGGVK
jgi:hypothetical protein